MGCTGEPPPAASLNHNDFLAHWQPCRVRPDPQKENRPGPGSPRRFEISRGHHPPRLSATSSSTNIKLRGVMPVSNTVSRARLARDDNFECDCPDCQGAPTLPHDDEDPRDDGPARS